MKMYMIQPTYIVYALPLDAQGVAIRYFDPIQKWADLMYWIGYTWNKSTVQFATPEELLMKDPKSHWDVLKRVLTRTVVLKENQLHKYALDDNYWFIEMVHNRYSGFIVEKIAVEETSDFAFKFARSGFGDQSWSPPQWPGT